MKRDFSKIRRLPLGPPQRMAPIVRKLVWRHEFKPGSELCVYRDNEEHTYEAVLSRTGLPTRSARVPKDVDLSPVVLLRHLL